MGRAAEFVAPSSSLRTDGGFPVAQVNDLSRSLTAFDPISTLVVVVEMSKASWLVSGAIPGVERQPLKKLEPDATALLRLIERWRNEAGRAGRPISRMEVCLEDRLQYEFERTLYHPIPNRRNRKDADFAPVLRYFLLPSRQWHVVALIQFVPNLFEEGRDALRFDD